MIRAREMARASRKLIVTQLKRLAVNERLGIRAVTLISVRAQLAAYRALRLKRDPTSVVLAIFSKFEQLILEAMLAAHLEGLATSLENVSRSPLKFTSSTYRSSLAALRKRTKIPVEALESVELVYKAAAEEIAAKTIAVIERQLQKAVVNIHSKGLTTKEGTRLLAKAFDKAGLTAKNSYSLEAVFRTQTQLAYSAGQYEQDQHPDIQEILWGYEYTTAGDDRVRDTHVALDGMTLPKNSPLWNNLRPPNGWACRCQLIPLFEEEKIKEPPEFVSIKGKQIPVRADRGFDFHPGKRFRTFVRSRI